MKVLWARTRWYLAMIAGDRQAFQAELAEPAGRIKSNLSRTLKTMPRYGLVELTEQGR